MKTAINTTLGLLLATITLLLGSGQSFAQKDTTKEPVVFENKHFKLKFYDKGDWLDSTSRKELEEALSDVEQEMEELQRDLQEELGDMEGMTEEEKAEIKKQLQKSQLNKKPKVVETSTFVMDVGINALINEGTLDMPEAYTAMELDRVRAINFHLGVVQQGVNISKGKLRFVYGLGIEYNNYRFTEDIDLIKNSDPLAFTENDETNYRKNKLVSQYLTMPLMLNFKSNPHNDDESFKLAAGIQLGYLVGSHTKQKWGKGRDKEKRKIRGDYQFEEYRYGYVVQIGYGDFNLYGKYYPTSAFKAGKGPQVQTTSVGLVLTPF